MTHEITFLIPPELWLTANGRLHWAEKARRVQALRQLGYITARNQGIRDLDPCHVTAYIGFLREGRADPSNASDTVKPLIDGMVDAGVWPDDDHTHVLGPICLRDRKSTGAYRVRLVLTSQEVPF